MLQRPGKDPSEKQSTALVSGLVRITCLEDHWGSKPRNVIHLEAHSAFL